MFWIYYFKGAFKKQKCLYIAVMFVISYAHIGKVITKRFDCNIDPPIFSAHQNGGVSETNFVILNIYLYNVFVNNFYE